MPSDNEVVLQQVQTLRTMLINVGTGITRIQDAEAEYTQLRGEVAQKLRALGIADVNAFFSLWDWYNYWKENGLSSYQSRRNYINGLYKQVIDGLERGQSAELVEPDSRAAAPFSIRHGYKESTLDAEISIREEAPEGLRRTLLDIATQTGWDYDDLLSVASRIGKQPWEPSEPIIAGKQSRLQVASLVSKWEWYMVYDFIEALYDRMTGWDIPGTEPTHPCNDFHDLLNGYFRHAGIGWELRGGKIISRGSEAFETVIRRTAPALNESRQDTARKEIHEALNDLSRRPNPDITGAIQHAMAALECIARTVVKGV